MRKLFVATGSRSLLCFSRSSLSRRMGRSNKADLQVTVNYLPSALLLFNLFLIRPAFSVKSKLIGPMRLHPLVGGSTGPGCSL